MSRAARSTFIFPSSSHEVAEGNFAEAYEIITATNALPALSGPCLSAGDAVRVQVRARHTRASRSPSAASSASSPTGTARTSTPCRRRPQSNGIKVAVVGSGPSGLTCASELAKKGYQVSMFEALHTAGGVLVYGIPEFRLPKAIVANEVEKLKAQGVEVMTDMVIGKVLSIDDLFESWASRPSSSAPARACRCSCTSPAKPLKGVCSANEYLTRINLMKAYLEESDTPILHSKAAAIVGGGNVAMDAARCAKRMGAEKVYIVYRRGEAEMPARLEEQHHAKEEGIEFMTLTNPD